MMYVFAAVHVYECAWVCVHLHKGQRTPLMSVLLRLPGIRQIDEADKAGRTKNLRICPFSIRITGVRHHAWLWVWVLGTGVWASSSQGIIYLRTPIYLGNVFKILGKLVQRNGRQYS